MEDVIPTFQQRTVGHGKLGQSFPSKQVLELGFESQANLTLIPLECASLKQTLSQLAARRRHFASSHIPILQIRPHFISQIITPCFHWKL